MIPFSLQCIKCGEYMYRGRSSTSRKEDVIGDDYLGIKKYRFYIKCCVCNNEIAFKTDPKNQDYVCESGLFSASPAETAPTRHRRDPTPPRAPPRASLRDRRWTDQHAIDATRNAGATRNFESWRQQDEAEEKFEGERKEAQAARERDVRARVEDA